MREAFDPASTCLPVAEVIGELKKALSSRGRAVLCAPPGGGKSTLVPPSLLGADFLRGGRILMLEPRRLAARNTSKRIAFLLKSAPGEIAGCHTRFDHIGNKDVPIDVVTEGVLLRMIQNDPALTGVGLVIFDEFHERSIDADLGLALTLESASALREDLKILVMSATLDAEKTASLLKDENDPQDVPVIVSKGKMFPVETFYRPPDPHRDLAGNVCSAVADALAKYPGDVLVFLPGEGEIRQCLKLLETMYPDRAGGLLHFHPLYGNLPPEEQDAALLPAPEKERKVILATTIAETSLTVENVRIVIDSGLMRCAVYSPASGMDHLETRRVSRASAEPRKGRAGRTAPGVCLRLWHISEERGMLPFNVPGIREADLASFALQIAQWGILPSGVKELKLPDPPPKGAMDQAWDLLFRLGAVDPASGRITPYGKELSKFALHPRLAHMVLAAEKAGKRALGCAIAALLQEKDILPKCGSSDLLLRLAALAPGGGGVPKADLDPGALHRVENILGTEFHIRKNDLKKEEIFSSSPGTLLACAYPDRIGRKLPGKKEVLLANGKSCFLPENDPLSRAEFLSVAVAEGLASVPKIRLAAALDISGIPESWKKTVYETFWNSTNKNIEAWEVVRIGSLALSRKKIPASSEKIPMEQRQETLFKGLRLHGAGVLPWSEKQLSVMKRSSFLHKYTGEPFPELSPETLLDDLETWLAPFLNASVNSVSALSGEILANAFDSLFDHTLKHSLEKLAPERIEVPTSSKIKVDYEQDPPHLAVRLQELFGMMETPAVAGGKVRVVMEILSPAMRPIQVTSDLAGFWKSSYFLVRKEMRGRYPKHDWPEDPLSAVPHRGVRRPSPPPDRKEK